MRPMRDFIQLSSLRLAAVVVLLCVLPDAQAADSIADYLEPSTVCVLRANLQQLDLPACVQAVQQELPGMLPTQVIGGVQAAAGAALQGLRDAGAQELYVTLSTIELTNGKAMLIVPCDNVDAMAQQLRNLIGILPPAFGYSVHQGPGAAIACTDAVWNRLQAKPQSDSGNLLQALRDQADLHLSINIAVRDSLRHTVSDIWPEKLPSSIPVELSPKQLMGDVQAVQVGIVSPPELRIEAGINCVDAAAAKRTLLALQSLLNVREVSLPIATARANRVVVQLDRKQIGELVQRFMPTVQNRTASMQHSNNLKQLALAVHNFNATYGGLPPRMTVSATGQPLLSWRVHVLPFMGEEALYQEFHLDEPWFSQHNKRLVERMPATYRLLTEPGLEPGMTCIQAPRMAGSLWDGNENRLLTFRDLADGTSNTICFAIVPGSRAVIWTQPEDLQVEPADVKEGLFGDRSAMQVVFFDGSVQTIGNTFPPETYRAWLTHAGGEPVERP